MIILSLKSWSLVQFWALCKEEEKKSRNTPRKPTFLLRFPNTIDMEKIPKTLRERVKTMSKSGTDPPKSSKIVQKSKNHQKRITEIPKHHEQCSKTWSKPEKHAKIAKTLKQRSKNHVFFEKSCTGAQENCSKSSIFAKNHEFWMAKIPKTLGERVKTMSKSGSDPPKSSKID